MGNVKVVSGKRNKTSTKARKGESAVLKCTGKSNRGEIG